MMDNAPLASFNESAGANSGEDICKNSIRKQKVARLARLTPSDGVPIGHWSPPMTEVPVGLRLLRSHPRQCRGIGIAVGDSRVVLLVLAASDIKRLQINKREEHRG